MACKICSFSPLNTYQSEPLILECPNCGNSFKLKIPEKIDEWYSRGIHMPNFFDRIIRNQHHFNFIDKVIGFKNINSILEIGPGDGTLIKFIRERNKKIKITAIEPGEKFIKALSEIDNVEVITDFIENVTLENKVYDLIIMSHVLEHLEDPLKTLQYIYNNFMGNGCYLYIDIPNRDYELRNPDAALVVEPSHLFYFSDTGISWALKKVGFEQGNISGNKYATLPARSIQIMQKIGALKAKKKTGTILLKLMNKITLYSTRWAKWIGNKTPMEIPLTEKNSNFNNIAVIAKKNSA